MSGPNATVWQPNLQEGEFTQGIAEDIADASANQLVDASGNNIVDDGTTFTPIAATIWSVNDTA